MCFCVTISVCQGPISDNGYYGSVYRYGHSNASLTLGLLKRGMKPSSHVALHLRDIKFFHGSFGTGMNLTRIKLISGPWCWIQGPMGGQRKEETSWNDSEWGGKKKNESCIHYVSVTLLLSSRSPSLFRRSVLFPLSGKNPCLPLRVLFVI